MRETPFECRAVFKIIYDGLRNLFLCFLRFCILNSKVVINTCHQFMTKAINHTLEKYKNGWIM